jgi:hypothetical protein
LPRARITAGESATESSLADRNGALGRAVIARERSDEAIQARLTELSLDCFVASLPRNDGQIAQSRDLSNLPLTAGSKLFFLSLISLKYLFLSAVSRLAECAPPGAQKRLLLHIRD